MPTAVPELNKEQFNSLKNLLNEKFPEFIEDMMNNMQSHMEKILYGLEQKDLHTIEKSAHSLSSNCSYIGAIDIQDLARQIEHMAEDQTETGHIDMSALTPLIKSLQAQINDLKAVIYLEASAP